MTIEYDVRFDRTEEHRIKVHITLPTGGATTVDLVLPSWVPGSYWIQEYVRNVRSLRASAEPGGAPLAVERASKSRWRIPAAGLEQLHVDLEVYGHGLITEGLDLTSEHLLLNAGVCLPYVDGRKEEACDLVLHLPDGWRVYTELTEVGHHPARFRAKDYDELLDSPVDCGTPLELTASAAGIPHRIVLCGRGGNFEPHRLEEEVHRIAETTIRLFGECPVPRFTMFFHLTDEPDGGLEHRASFSAVIPRTAFKPAKRHEYFLRLTSHEYFHLYNVKRIRPKTFLNFDYTKEQPTRLLWAMEGTTSYYGDLLLRRAGLATPERYLAWLGEDLALYLNTPGRTVKSLELESTLSWVDFYRPYEETVNQSANYYRKGALVSWALDLELRHATENRATLDSVWRRLWTDFGRVGRGLEEDEMPRVVQAATGVDVDGFFARHIGGTEEVDYARTARFAGLELSAKPKSPEPEEGEPGYLGIEFRDDGGMARVTQVRDGSPARRAGLDPGDEVVALDGVKVKGSAFGEAWKRYPPGSAVALTVFRRGFLTTVNAVTGQAPPESYLLTPLERPTELERAIYESWLETAWTPPKKEKASPAPAPTA
ncbi:MAG: PDZ domain-containing protein [Thermoplasmata archaeon]|nr:PDZ domain-containing protein [Thermoplasmata archaeon]